jgi:hypothetical protein
VRLLRWGWLGPPVVCWMRDSETACMPCVCSEFDVRVRTWYLWECVLVSCTLRLHEPRWVCPPEHRRRVQLPPSSVAKEPVICS